MQGMMAASNGSSKPAGSPANTSPPTSKAPPPTPPQKGSPAITSPAGPRSVGKGGPRTPAGEMSGGKGATPKMVSPSTSASKLDRPMPAPNVTVNQMSMGGEAIIEKVSLLPGAGQREHEMVNILFNGSPSDKERVRQMMQQDPELNNSVVMLCRQRQMGMQPEMAAHQPQAAGYSAQRQPVVSIRQPQSGGFSPGHPQLMRAMPAQPVQHYSPHMGSYRTTSYHQPVHHMVGPGQVYSPQTHHSPQLSRILARPPVQNFQPTPNAYSQMAQPVGPPPYMARMPPQPQTVGYPHMLGHHHPQQMPAHNPMAPSVGPHMPTGHAHQFGASPQGVPMDHGVPGDPNFVYNDGTHQQTYSINTNNSNNLSQATYLTPADRLSTLTEFL